MIWTGAKNTGGIGLRTDRRVLAAGASPIHLGVDHAGTVKPLRMPFDGMWKWEEVGGVAGSLLRITPPIGSEERIEVQIFHTLGKDQGWREAGAGDEIPVEPGDLGLSVGIHTHTELLQQFNRDEPLPAATLYYVTEGIPRRGNVLMHCRRHMMKMATVWPLVEKQVAFWEIEHATDRWGVRRSLPAYRRPWFGDGWTLHRNIEELFRADDRRLS